MPLPNSDSTAITTNAMKNASFILNGAASILAVALLSATAVAGEDIAISSLPEPVSKAVKEQFPKGELIKAEKESDDSGLKYELKIREDGKLKEAHVSPEGKILKVEME